MKTKRVFHLSSRAAGLTFALGLSFAEVLRFGHCAWWWRLRYSVWREFRQVDVAKIVLKRTSEELAYGETPTVTLARVLELAELKLGSTVVDLGAGRGTALMAAAALGYRAAGIEIVEAYVAPARRVAQKLGLEVDFRCGDFVTDEWPEGDLYLLNSTAFPTSLRDKLEKRLYHIDGYVVTYDWELNSEFFEQQAALRLPVSVGTVMCRLFRVAKPTPKYELE